LQTGGGHAAGVGSLGGGEHQASALDGGNGLGGAGHVSALKHTDAAVGDEGLGGLLVQLVLGGAGQSDVAGHSPDAGAALHILGSGDVVQVGLDAGALDLLDLLDDLIINAVLVYNVTIGVGH